MFRITVMSKEGVSDRLADRGADVHEELRQLGLEWKNASWPLEQRVVVVIEPYDPEPDRRAEEVQAKVRAAAEALEGTGLL